jgi:hypothetical protein
MVNRGNDDAASSYFFACHWIDLRADGSLHNSGEKLKHRLLAFSFFSLTPAIKVRQVTG